MSNSSSYPVPLRQGPPRPSRKHNAHSATQTGRIEKTCSNPSSPGPLQRRRRALLPVRSIPALREAYRRPSETGDLARHAPCVPADGDADASRPVSWHPDGQEVATWNTYTPFYGLPSSSPLDAVCFPHDDLHGAAIHYADSQPPSGWSSFGQSSHALADSFPILVGSSFGDEEAPSTRLPQPYSFGGQSLYFNATFPPPGNVPLVQNLSFPSQYFPQTQILPPFQDYPFAVPDLEPDSQITTVSRPSQPIPVPKDKPITSESNDLVGMGLYDEPENTSSWDPQSAQYQSLLLSAGKGWKLEETFQPQGEDMEADKSSSIGDDEYHSPSLDLDFEDFNPLMSDEVDPTGFESTFDHVDQSAAFPWVPEDSHPSFVSGAEYYSSMHPFMGYSMM